MSNNNYNTGYRNTGYRNTGDYNTGYRNTGYHNTGDCNTGYRNTGYRNTGDCNTGYRNTGYHNTGYCNTGDYNTGYRNTGDCNTGYHNTGDCNTGDYNTGDYNTGWFNTTTPDTANYFNMPARITDWNKADKPDWIFQPLPTTWVKDSEMTDVEKADNPTFHTCGGYLRVNDMKEEWAKAYSTASDEDVQKVRDLPNFDADVFDEITGLDLRVSKFNTCVGKVVEIDGVKYELKELKDAS